MEKRRRDVVKQLSHISVQIPQDTVHGRVGRVELATRRLDAQLTPRMVVHAHRQFSIAVVLGNIYNQGSIQTLLPWSKD